MCGVSLALPQTAALGCVCLPLCSEGQEAPKAIHRTGTGAGPRWITVPVLEIVAETGRREEMGRRAAGQTSVL